MVRSFTLTSKMTLWCSRSGPRRKTHHHMVTVHARNSKILMSGENINATFLCYRAFNHRSIVLIGPLGGAEQLFVQHLAPCLGSEPQTLGKALLCPYKAAIHPLPSSSPAPFLCLSQTRGIFTECLSQPGLPYLELSSSVLQPCCTVVHLSALR